ncbi:PQQ-like beta-propeller repeat protein (plasmid) [Deinococcus taeanensis]|uniref:outer membrane protein assembly factor BamB family protein n=1 Tax=Deinococcus taeanensis TaxID=2737050 RepID=UPI001CDBB08A|nr:PQQ-binding-like beta-propeller repeat protein [Deinococcus taeanensis]UBV45123.1 PQQ-like beta-propeller repeat protein [Deinococcus taeanensis]
MAESGAVIVCPARRTKLIALDRMTGQEYWRANIQNPWGTLALSATHVYFLNQHARLDAFDLHRGARLWSTELPGPSGWLHADERSVVVGGWRNYTPLTCLEAATGEVRWTVHLGSAQVLRTAIYAPLQAVAMHQGMEGQIRWLSLHDGHERLTLSLKELQPDSCDVIPRGVFGQEPRGLLVRSGSGNFYRLTGDRAVVEHHQTGQNLLSRPLDERDGQVFFLNRRNEFCVYDLVEQHTLVMERVDHLGVAPLPARRLLDGSYVLGTSSGTLWHFNAAGKRISRRRVCTGVTTELFTDGRTIAFRAFDRIEA